MIFFEEFVSQIWYYIFKLTQIGKFFLLKEIDDLGKMAQIT